MYQRQLIYSGRAYGAALTNPTQAQPYDLHTHQQWIRDKLVTHYGYFYDEEDRCYIVPVRFLKPHVERDGSVLYSIRNEYWRWMETQKKPAERKTKQPQTQEQQPTDLGNVLAIVFAVVTILLALPIGTAAGIVLAMLIRAGGDIGVLLPIPAFLDWLGLLATSGICALLSLFLVYMFGFYGKPGW